MNKKTKENKVAVRHGRKRGRRKGFKVEKEKANRMNLVEVPVRSRSSATCDFCGHVKEDVFVSEYEKRTGAAMVPKDILSKIVKILDKSEWIHPMFGESFERVKEYHHEWVYLSDDMEYRMFTNKEVSICPACIRGLYKLLK